MNINALTNIKSGERFILSGDSVTVQTKPKSFWQWLTGVARLTPTLTKINEYIEKNKGEILKSPETKKDLKELKTRLDVAVQSYKDKHSRLYLWFFGRHVDQEWTKIKKNIQELCENEPITEEEIIIEEEPQKEEVEINKKEITQQHKEVKINSSDLEILNQLFKDSPYPIQGLPVYPKELLAENDFPVLEDMGSNPVMIGRSEGGDPFIALQLNTTLSQKQIKEYWLQPYIKKKLEETPDQNGVFVLYETPRGEWAHKCSMGYYSYHNFFDFDVVMNLKNNNALLQYQKNGFGRLKTVIQEGSGPDKNGLIWKIAKYN
jgi:hypothetical protein